MNPWGLESGRGHKIVAVLFTTKSSSRVLHMPLSLTSQLKSPIKTSEPVIWLSVPNGC